jgi:hypothetical protein
MKMIKVARLRVKKVEGKFNCVRERLKMRKAG